jgi:acyl-coenzyme A thioesterase PaaI-like protein
MSTEDARLAAAASLRRLNHAFSAADPDDDTVNTLVRAADELTTRLDGAARRDRMALMRAAYENERFPPEGTRAGFDDRAVAGRANPMSMEIDVTFEKDVVIGRFEFSKGFEGAPGRAHGGMVAAAFDEVTGNVIGMLHEPAFTGELTVRYLEPSPIDEPIEIRAWLNGRERRKLFIEAEARTTTDRLVAVCHAIYVTVDPSVFAAAPDPR